MAGEAGQTQAGSSRAPKPKAARRSAAGMAANPNLRRGGRDQIARVCGDVARSMMSTFPPSPTPSQSHPSPARAKRGKEVEPHKRQGKYVDKMVDVRKCRKRKVVRAQCGETIKAEWRMGETQQ